jgi:hypothetical protein
VGKVIVEKAIKSVIPVAVGTYLLGVFLVDMIDPVSN